MRFYSPGSPRAAFTSPPVEVVANLKVRGSRFLARGLQITLFRRFSFIYIYIYVFSAFFLVSMTRRYPCQRSKASLVSQAIFLC